MRFSLKQCKKTIVFFALFFCASAAFAQDKCTEVYGMGQNMIRLATGSPGELGLVKALAEEFSKGKETGVCWIKAGSGEALKMLKEKHADMIMVHAPAAEKQAVAEGWAVKRHLIGSNEFYIVGPEADPAGIRTAKSAAEAYGKIASVKAPFLSRGDNSGTHKKEMDVWKKAGIEPAGEWYVVTKTFMTATLKKADEMKGYFMADSSTWAAVKKEMANLRILFRGDPMLINTYHTLCQPESATPMQKYASEFIDFVISEKGQEMIRNYGVPLYGEGLYNDAEYAKQYDH